jgi:hypothetical protein
MSPARPSRFTLRSPHRTPGSRRRLLASASVAAGGAALVAAAVTISGTAFAGTTLFADDFSAGTLNGWSKSGGTWSVVTDSSPALRQSKATTDLARAFAGTTGWTDYTVQARVKPVTTDGSAWFVGLAARSSSSTSFDRLVLNAGTVQLQAVRSGTVTVLASAPLSTATGTWYTLRIEEAGTTVRGYVDGTLIGSGTGQSGKGRIGVQTNRAAASFDDVVVTSTGSTPSPSPTTPSASPSASPSVSPSVSPSGSPSVSQPTGGRAIVVATTGNDANAGTAAAPYRSIQKAIDTAAAGDVITVHGGTYALSTNIQITKSGTAAKPITLTAAANERVVIDGEALPASHTAVGGSIARPDRGAIHMEASYWRLVGLELTRGPYGIYCDGCNNNVFDRLVTVNNYESGFQLQGASSNNQILNLDSSLNHDPRKNGESADGLAIKEGTGTGNVVRGARLWNNVDDGLDLWKFTSPVQIDSSVSWANGVNRWNFPNFAGDGNGFKLGGGGPATNHVIRNSIAFDNAQGGFIDNTNAGSLTVVHNTAYHNGGTGFDFADSTSTLTGNLSVANTTDRSLGSGSKGSGNSWDLGGTWNAASLLSTDPSTITGHRAMSGAIPSSNFLRPANGADVGARI